jgi:serine/threonine protein kinase
MQEHNVVHGDIKCSNILIFDVELIKLIDFGIYSSSNEPIITQSYSTLAGYDQRGSYIIGSNHMDLSYTHVDNAMWALGVCISDILLGKELFNGQRYVDGVPLICYQMNDHLDNTLKVYGLDAFPRWKKILTTLFSCNSTYTGSNSAHIKHGSVVRSDIVEFSSLLKMKPLNKYSRATGAVYEPDISPAYSLQCKSLVHGCIWCYKLCYTCNIEPHVIMSIIDYLYRNTVPIYLEQCMNMSIPDDLNVARLNFMDSSFKGNNKNGPTYKEFIMACVVVISSLHIECFTSVTIRKVVEIADLCFDVNDDRYVINREECVLACIHQIIFEHKGSIPYLAIREHSQYPLYMQYAIAEHMAESICGYSDVLATSTYE